jgi:hypothetical protein
MSYRERARAGGPIFDQPEEEQGGTGGNPPPQKPTPGYDRGVDA